MAPPSLKMAPGGSAALRRLRWRPAGPARTEMAPAGRNGTELDRTGRDVDRETLPGAKMVASRWVTLSPCPRWRRQGGGRGSHFRPHPSWRRRGPVRMCGAPWRDKGPSARRAARHGEGCEAGASSATDARGNGAMKGQQKAAETEEGTVQIQEGAVATGEDPTSVAIASIQSAATFPDPNIKYVFRTENGGTQVMYRVIQVADGQLDGQTEGTSAISGYPATQSMTQAVIQGAFTSEDAVETEAAATETHYTYFPTTAVADTSTSGGAGTTATAVVTTQNSEALLGQPTPTGQFFVMMSPQEVLQGGTPRSIAPRAHPYSSKSEAPRATRDEKRRAQHNEVERRRRDKINNWIVQLSKIIPDCSMENTKSGQSKGGILSKACDYIQELRQSNHRLSEELQGLDQLQMDNEVLRQQVEDLKNKNLILRAQLRQHGVEIVIKNDTH